MAFTMLWAVLVTAAPQVQVADPLDQPNSFTEVIGWSADETRLALRISTFEQFDPAAPDVEACGGTVDGRGKPFVGSIAVAVYEKGKLVQVYEPHPWPACSSKEATQREEQRALAAFKKLGIVPGRTGTRVRKASLKIPLHERATQGRLTRVERVELPGGAAVEYELRTSAVEPPGAETADSDVDAPHGKLEGTEGLWLVNKSRTRLVERPVLELYTTFMGGSAWLELGTIDLSPSGRWLVAFSEVVTVTGHQGTRRLKALGWHNVSAR